MIDNPGLSTPYDDDVLDERDRQEKRQLAALRQAREAMHATVTDAMHLPASGMTSRASIVNVARMRIAIAEIDDVLEAQTKTP